MKEIEYLGTFKTGHIDKRYGTESTESRSLFECPVCNKQYVLKTSRGHLQKTCITCRGSQSVKHNMSSHKAYKIWQVMIQRCTNPKSQAYPRYGGKGITVSKEWLTFEQFWADMGSTYQDGWSIDRIDSSKGYNKENCRWLTRSENSRLTSRRRPVVQMRKELYPHKHFVEMQSWESAAKAAQALGLVAGQICNVCQGHRETHGGFGWKYL